MRRVASLFALCLAMAWLHHLTAGSALAARAGFALGFLLVGAWLAGEATARAGLPRLTGFLILGLSVGPAWLNLVRPDELDALSFIAHGAVALIAFAVGQELSLAPLRAERRALFRLVGGTVGFPAIAVTAIVLSVAPWFPLTLHQGIRNAAGVALTLGLCAAATSPIVVLGVMEDFGARGAFAEGVLRVAAVNPVVVAAALVVVLAGARGLGTAGAVDGAVAPALALGVVGALAAGAVLGILASAYVRRALDQAPLVLIGLGLTVAALHTVFGLEPTLVALASGAVARNAGGVGAARLGRVGKEASLAVQTVLFALTGAALRVGVLDEVWPWVVLLAGVRVVAIRYGTLWAARDAAVSPALGRRGWLGLVSQSGIALALAAAARRAFPGWGVSFEALVAGTVVVNELVGPLCLRWCLVRERAVPGPGTGDVGSASGGTEGRAGATALRGQPSSGPSGPGAFSWQPLASTSRLRVVM